MPNQSLKEKIEYYKNKLKPDNTYVVELSFPGSFEKIDILHKNKIPYDEIIRFENTEDKEVNPIISRECAFGFTFFIKRDNQYYAVVVINTSSIFEKGERLGNIILLTTIIHEYKHAEDGNIGNNINLSKKSIDLVRFEIEAEIRSIQIFINEGEEAELALQLLAVKILKWLNSKNEYELKIAEGLLKKYPIERIDEWAMIYPEAHEIFSELLTD